MSLLSGDERRCPCGHTGPEPHCHICHDQVPSLGLLDHLRVHHPDQFGDGPQTWPDGSLVVVDTTLEPGDFR